VSIPAVSLVVTTYNHARFVEQCLDSVAAQTFRDFELLIIDDASVDGTSARIQTWLDRTDTRAAFIANERNLGICACRNLALRHSQGEFFSTLSGDDYYEPEKLASEYEFFATLDGSAGAVFSNMRLVDEDGCELASWFESGWPPAEGAIFERLVEHNYLPAPTVMTRRAALLQVGGYDETLAYEDLDMWLKLADRFEFRYIPELLVNYRVLPTALSRAPEYELRVRETRVRVLLKWFGRSPHVDAAIVRLAWANGRRALAVDPAVGRQILSMVCDARPSLRRRVALELSAVPGTRLVARAAFAISDRRRRRSRTTVSDRG
jgi:glycosyltransferase involved in cell wall biosynthesis